MMHKRDRLATHTSMAEKLLAAEGVIADLRREVAALKSMLAKAKEEAAKARAKAPA